MKRKLILSPFTTIPILQDNASYWQGYLGYPGIAVLMLQGKLPYDKELVQQFAGVDWNKINQEYKRNYAQAADAVMTAKGIDKKKAETELHHVYDALKQLPIIVKRGALRPPKSKLKVNKRLLFYKKALLFTFFYCCVK